MTTPTASPFNLSDLGPADDESPDYDGQDLGRAGQTIDESGKPVCAMPGCTTRPRKGNAYCSVHRDGKSADTKPSGVRGPRGSQWKEATSVETALVTILGGVGAVVTMIDPFDGKVVKLHAAKVAHELTELARIEPRYRDILVKITAPGKYGPLVAALGMMILPIAMHHGLLGNLLPNPVQATQNERITL